MQTRFDYKILEEINLRDYLLSYYLSKSKVYKLFMEKKVLVNNEFKKESFLLCKGDIVSILLDEEIDYKPIDYDLDILYEDDYFLIINKPSGIIIHSEKDQEEVSLSNYVAGYYKRKDYHLNVRFAHRLDKETTGVIVYCKDILAHAYMNYYISTHDIQREYRLLVQGSLKENKGRLTYPIGQNRHISNKMVVSKNGKEAITNFEQLYKYKGYSLVRAILETGRTHQIRLHFSHYGNPLLGDTLYGGAKNKIERVALHSYKIDFIHPVFHKELSIIAPMPEDMKCLMREDLK